MRLAASIFAILALTAPVSAQQAGKVSQMPFASTPLNGTELLYLVQGGISVKCTVTQCGLGAAPGNLTITDGTNIVANTNHILFNNALVGGATPNGTVTVPTLTVTDGTHTVTGTTHETFVNATVSGSTPNATITALGSGGQTYTDGTHTVAGATQLTVTGGTIGGISPNATLAISGGGSGITFTDGTHTVTGTTQLSVTGGVIGGATPNGTLTITPSLTVGTTVVNSGTSGFALTDNGGVLGNVPLGVNFTDGVHTVASAANVTVVGGVVSGSTPNATITVPNQGQTYTDGVHTVTGATQLTVTGLTIGGSTPNATGTVNYATNSDVWTHTSTTTAINPAVAATSVAPQTFTESAGTFSINFNSGINLELPLVHADCPCTIANPTNVYAGLSGNMTLLQSATGSDTIGTWGTTWKFSGGVKPTLTATANAIDVLPFYCRTTTFCVITFIANAQ